MAERGDLRKHIYILRSIARQLLDSGIKIEDGEMVAALLNSLPKRYAITITVIQQKKSITFDKVVARLLTEDIRNNEYDDSTKKGSEEEALHVQSRGPPPRGRFGGPKFCKYCKRSGHTEDDCWTKTREQQGQGFNNNQQRRFGNNFHPQDQQDRNRSNHNNNQQNGWRGSRGQGQHTNRPDDWHCC